MEIEQARAAIVQMKALAGPQHPVSSVEPVEIARPDGSSPSRRLFTGRSPRNLRQRWYTCTAEDG